MSGPPQQTPTVSGTAHPGLLTELMSNTLDQDYQVAAERAARGSTPRKAAPGRLAALLVVLMFGGMIGVSALRTAQQRPAAEAERNQLVAQAHQRQHHLDLLHAQLSNLERDVASLQSEAGRLGGQEQRLGANVTRLSGITGAGGVTGPGVRITVNDAPGAQELSNGMIMAGDLQTLVNALWQSGAEAVSINGQRLTSLSAIRVAGQAITLNYRSLSPPYVVEAVGDPNTLPARLAETPGGQAWLSLEQNYGIRFRSEPATNLTLPGATGVTVRQARGVPAR